MLLPAELAAKSASIDKVESILRSLVDTTRDELGNIVYAVRGREDDPNRFVLYQVYKGLCRLQRAFAAWLGQECSEVAGATPRRVGRGDLLLNFSDVRDYVGC